MPKASGPWRWVFCLGRGFLAPEGDPFAAGLGGTEQALLGLTGALATRGHAVCVQGGLLRGASTERVLDGVRWVAADGGPADLAVAVNDATLLPRDAALPVVWFHNEVEALREWRKGRLGALRHLRPQAVFIGREQARTASRLLPFRGRRVIPYGLQAVVLDRPPSDAIAPPHAVFTSQAYRGLRELITVWREHIAPALPHAIFTAFIGDADVAAYARLAQGCPGIAIRRRLANTALLEQVAGARLLLAPGHRSETFCLAAAEAIALGVPVVTLGIGSLKERVRDGVDGFVCDGWGTLAARTRAVLSDDALWGRLHEAALAGGRGRDWGQAAAEWEELAAPL